MYSFNVSFDGRTSNIFVCLQVENQRKKVVNPVDNEKHVLIFNDNSAWMIEIARDVTIQTTLGNEINTDIRSWGQRCLNCWRHVASGAEETQRITYTNKQADC